MANDYYILLVKDNQDWCLAFGDYDRETVADELQICVDGGVIPKKDMKIVACSDDTQVSINNMVNLHNIKFD